MRLDEAHRTFEKLDVDEFDDIDGVEDNRDIIWDANWVVIEQEPAAGTKEVDTGEIIKLTVANEDDDELLDLIPEGSPVAEEFAAKRAAEAKEEAEEREEKEAQEGAKANDDPYSEYRGKDGFVTRDDYGDAWPLTVDGSSTAPRVSATDSVLLCSARSGGLSTRSTDKQPTTTQRSDRSGRTTPTTGRAGRR